MRRLLLFLLAAGSFAAEPDAREIVRKSLEADQRNSEILRNYTFLERVERIDLDQDGNARKRDVKSWDVTPLEGSIYRRLVERNDQPLSPDEEAAEQAKLSASLRDRLNETPAERAKRIKESDKQRDKNRKAVAEIPEAFDFRLAGEEIVDGRPAWVIKASPKPGYRPRSTRAGLFTKLAGTLWIDQATYNWVRAEAELTDTWSVGWILVRVHQGASVRIDNLRLNDEVWAPDRIRFRASARVGLVKHVRLEQENRYRGYRKFVAEARVTAVEEPHGESAMP